MSTVETLFSKLNINFKSCKNGEELQFNCINPSHPDRNASAYINTKTGLWHCFSCNASGNIHKIVKIRNGININLKDFITDKDSVKFKINSIYKDSSKEILSYENDVEFQRTFNAISMDFKPACADITSLTYLVKHRKLTKDTIKKYSLMYADKGEYRGRIVIPYYNNGQIIGFNSRLITNANTNMRYRYFLNERHFNGYLYNLENITNNEYCILVEGPFDLMYLVQCGYKNVISTLSTRISLEHIIKLLSFKKIIFCFDNDIESQAGFNAVMKHSDIILNYDPDIPIYYTELPPGQDPNSCDKETLKKCFGNLRQIKKKPEEQTSLIFRR